MVAKWYRLDPVAVESWTNRDFLDRQEYMYYQQEIQEQYNNFLSEDR